ncbi:MAG: hypothetical protein VXY73_04605 [Pseudomonadota bacterium]|nr:hypothetical protein [Pseudomonadota bacterium]MEC8795926.1 hypothetical protein [Pseudomonadota bacterium]
MVLFHMLRNRITDFARDERASLVAEAVLILPALVWWYVGSMVFFQGYQARNVNMKAAYTISDMISRQNAQITPATLNGLGNVFKYLVAGKGNDGRIRVTSVQCTAECTLDNPSRELTLLWSHGTGTYAAMTQAELADYAKYIPVMAKLDTVIIVETRSDFQTNWDKVGLDLDRFENIVVTRPRFMPSIPLAGQDDGTS